MRDRIFLSYASDDLDMIKSIYSGLTKRKLNVWFDQEHLKTGRWKPQIMKAISRSRFFVICISNAALRKTGDKRPGFQDHELNRAYDIAMDQPGSEFTIVPIRIEDCGRGDGDVRLTSFQQYDLFDDFKKGLDKLAVVLGGISLSDALKEDIRSKDQQVIESLMGRASALFYAGLYSKSLNMCDTLTVLEPDDAVLWANKGATLHWLERYEEALEAYNKAIELNPNDAFARRNKGIALERLERHEEALGACNKAIELKPDDAVAWGNKGIALGRLERYEESLEACNKAVELMPDNAVAWRNKGATLVRLKRYEGSLEAYNKAIELKPDDADTWRNKGFALERLERHKEALVAKSKANELDKKAKKINHGYKGELWQTDKLKN
jgi:tetratricopeptide (TPR) repeat protein